jgi:fluoroacetyl-CoA thioesterase
MAMPHPAPRASTPSEVHAGLSASVALTVTKADTALHLRSGDVPVLGTPRLVALCEEASCRALEGRLAPGCTSVGTRVQFDHLVPVPVGATVKADATLEKVEARRLVFTVSVALVARDQASLVAAGRLTRVVVQRAAFLEKAGCPEPGPNGEAAGAERPSGG